MKNSQAMKSGDVLCRRYRLEREIGKGGMGTVWAAYDCKTNDTVALKMILPQQKQHQTEELRRRLVREARAIKKLRHRNIVQIYGLGETPQGEPFVVLEYLQGQTLAAMLKESWRVEPFLAARIIADIAGGLAVAHAEQVIHRDLKPANIFLRRDPGMPEGHFVPTILDFGVCKELDMIDEIDTATGVVPGSLAYMSPEQIGRGKDLDRRTDIWSLGIMLYEVLTGARPFTGPALDLYEQILTKPVPAPSRRVREVPPKLDAVVARCCAAKPADRYGDTNDLANDLLAIAGRREMKRTPTPMAVMVPIVNPSAYKTPVVAIAVDDDSMPTTPYRAHVLVEKHRDDVRVEHFERAATSTQLMPLNQPIASPAPEWRTMYEALEAHRQSSTYLEGALQDGASSGQTVMLDPHLASNPISDDSTGTTSAAGALSQPGGGAALPPLPLSVSRRTRPFNKKALFGTVSAVFVVALVLMMWFVSSGDKLHANAASEVPSVTPNANATSTNETPTSESVSPQKPLNSVFHSRVPMSASVPVKPPPTATSSSTNAPIKSAPGATSSASERRQLPNGLGSWPKDKPPTKPQKCTGIGVFKRCK